jgi:hypothetical protein
MQLSTAVAATALLLAAALAAGYAHSGEPGVSPPTMQKKIEEREAKRRAAVAESRRRKEEFARRCTKPLESPFDLADCREMYRKLEM